MDNDNTISYILPHDSISVQNTFLFKNTNIKRFDVFNSSIDFIPFDGLRIGNFSDNNSIKCFLNNLNNHPNYEVSKKHKNIPVMFFHEHETLTQYQFYLLVKLISTKLKIEPKKIILIDTNLFERNGFLNQPLLLKIKQFNLKISNDNLVKDKKFTFLNNRINKLRFEVFDKVITNYQNNIHKLKQENIITFRNYKEDIKSESSDISNLKKLLNKSKYYKFNNDFDFYKKIDLPWNVDDFKRGISIDRMYQLQNKLYGQSYFSIVTETDWNGYDLDNENYTKNFMPFSEKTLKPMCSDNLPFIIHSKEYYKKFEEYGFDFSYLKKIFNIDYKNNNLKENFDSLNKFLSYLKNNTLDTIEKEYEKVYHVLENNKNIIKKIENNELDKAGIEFIQKIKKEKYE